MQKRKWYIYITKSFNPLKSAEPASGTQVKAGDEITYNIEVTNTSNEEKKNVLVLDSEYAWGIFKNGTDELIGYCTIGYADDVGDTIERHPEHTNDSLLLSDVYIDPQFRNKGYGIKLITEVIHNRWELDGDKNTVYLIAMYDKLKYFYEKIGFKPINDSEGKFHGAMVLSC